MATRCSVLFTANKPAYITSPQNDEQFYHHWDGYLEGVGKDIFDKIINQAKKDGRIELRYCLTHDYEKEAVGSIHGDWEYLYRVTFKESEITFEYSKDLDGILKLGSIHSIATEWKTYARIKVSQEVSPSTSPYVFDVIEADFTE